MCHHPNHLIQNPNSSDKNSDQNGDQADTGLVRPYGVAALGEPQGPGEAVEVDFDGYHHCVRYDGHGYNGY